MNWLFPQSTKQAIEYQQIMARKVLCQDEFGPLNLIAGMDVSNSLFDAAKMVYGAVALVSTKDRRVVEKATAKRVQDFPYIPGLLAFREAPVLIDALNKLTCKPDLLMLDGQGIAHPRGLGIASFIGVLLDIPTIGVAKSILVGTPNGELGPEAGSQVPLEYEGRIVAMLFRSKARTRPIIISPGHKVSLPSAVRIVQTMLGGYRLPEPTRQAHILANAFRASFQIPNS